MTITIKNTTVDVAGSSAGILDKYELRTLDEFVVLRSLIAGSGISIDVVDVDNRTDTIEKAIKISTGTGNSLFNDLTVGGSLSSLDEWMFYDAETASAHKTSLAELLNWIQNNPSQKTKKPVRLASVSNTIPNTLLPATLLDGTTLTIGDRVLLKDQTVTSENGVYVITVGGAVRDLDTLQIGDYWYVLDGTQNKWSFWVLSTTGTIGVQPQVFELLFRKASSSIGPGLTMISNKIVPDLSAKFFIDSNKISLQSGAVVGTTLLSSGLGMEPVWGPLTLSNPNSFSGILPFVRGGLGTSTISRGQIFVGDALGNLVKLNPGTNGQYLTINSSGDTAWTTWSPSGTFTISTAQGGTGQTTTVQGDLLVGDVGNLWKRLPRGTALQTLRVNAAGTDLEWSSPLAAIVSATNGGTGQTTTAYGDLLLGSATNTWNKLAKGTNGTLLTVHPTTGLVEWRTPDLTTDFVGRLPAIRGGTGHATITPNDLLVGDIGDTWKKLSMGVVGENLTVTAGGIAWGPVNISVANGVLTATNGGTGFANAARGEMLVGNTTGAWRKQAVGIANQPLITNSSGTDVEYGRIVLNDSNVVVNQLSYQHGGTGLNAVAIGDLLMGGNSSWLRLPVGAANKLLKINATGTLPEWGDATFNEITGVLSPSKGGTGFNAYANGDMLYGTGPATLSKLTLGATGKAMVVNGAGNAPSWGDIDLAFTYGNLSATKGGTGHATITPNDLLVGNTNSWNKLSVGAINSVLTVNAVGNVTWGSLSVASLSGILDADNGGTGFVSYVDGYFLIGNSSNSLQKLAKGTNGSYLQVQSGSVGWATPSFADFSGVLPSTKGGTGFGTYAVNDLLIGNSSNSLQKLAIASGNNVLSSDGTTITWGKVNLTTQVQNVLSTSNGGTGFGSASPNELLVGASGNWTKLVVGTSGNALTVNSSGNVVWSFVDIASTTGTLAANRGGTGYNTISDGQILVGNTSNSYDKLNPGTNGQYLKINALGDLEWNSLDVASLSGTVSATVGGTGHATITPNDLLVGNTNSWNKLSVGAINSVLSVNGSGNVVWATIDVSSATGTLAANRGGTAQSVVALGDLLVGNSANSWNKLALGSNNKILKTVSGSVVWSDVAANEITGVLAMNQGGTGIGGNSAGDIMVGNGGAWTTLGIGATNTVLTVVGGAPVWRNSKHTQSFSNSSWVINGSVYELLIPQTTHLRGVTPIVQIEEVDGADFSVVLSCKITISTNGNIKVSVPSAIDNRFSGRVIIQ